MVWPRGMLRAYKRCNNQPCSRWWDTPSVFVVCTVVCLVCVSGNGYIEGTELDGFLREFVSSANATDVSPEVSLTQPHVTLGIIHSFTEKFWKLTRGSNLGTLTQRGDQPRINPILGVGGGGDAEKATVCYLFFHLMFRTCMDTIYNVLESRQEEKKNDSRSLSSDKCKLRCSSLTSAKKVEVIKEVEKGVKKKKYGCRNRIWNTAEHFIDLT
uniref:Uncharacterized protein n=1 Tax=Timema poppense TaxID=170557 RepID=A0A7R9CUY2_TIMPO|nr:unnamed protein product [Timema poppensis]